MEAAALNVRLGHGSRLPGCGGQARLRITLPDRRRSPRHRDLRPRSVLDAVSLTLVAPVSVLAGALVLRGHRAGPVLGFGPAAYGWYMLLQFVVGPEYVYYPGALPLHLGLFVLSGAVAMGSWRAIRTEELPPASRRADGLRGVLLLAFSGFLLSRYVPLVADALGRGCRPKRSKA